MRRGATRRGLVLALLLALPGLAPVAAQQTLGPILTVDSEALFNTSRYGRSMRERMEQESQELIDENRRIEAELEAEEKRLTEERARLTPEDFRPLADAFDQKVTEARQTQDAKGRALVQRQEEIQQDFFRAVVPILTEILRENGAQMVLESRTVFLSSSQLDITQDAIARIDAYFFAASGGAGDAPDPDAPADPPTDPAADPAAPQPTGPDSPDSDANGAGTAPDAGNPPAQ